MKVVGVLSILGRSVSYVLTCSFINIKIFLQIVVNMGLSAPIIIHSDANVVMLIMHLLFD